MWGLYLGNMRHSNYEYSTELVALSEFREPLIQLALRELVEPYEDEYYGKTFKKSFSKGGLLEWFNPPGFRLVDTVNELAPDGLPVFRPVPSKSSVEIKAVMEILMRRDNELRQAAEKAGMEWDQVYMHHLRIDL